MGRSQRAGTHCGMSEWEEASEVMSRRENSGPEKYKGSFEATQGTFAPDSCPASFLLDLVTTMISRIFASRFQWLMVIHSTYKHHRSILWNATSRDEPVTIPCPRRMELFQRVIVAPSGERLRSKQHLKQSQGRLARTKPMVSPAWGGGWLRVHLVHCHLLNPTHDAEIF